MKQTNDQFIFERVQKYNREQDFNCAQITLLVLAEKFEFKLDPQIIDGSAGLNGAGQYRAQCGLVEGVLIFLGIYLPSINFEKEGIQKTCNLIASKFESKFGSLSCSKLRPNGFNEDDPPHLCEDLIIQSVTFAIDFVTSIKSI